MPDSTGIVQHLLDPQQWTLLGILGALAGIVSAVFAWLSLWPMWQHRRTQRVLEKSFGSELYGPETIERSTRYYIPPNCSSVDPAQEAEIRQVEVTEEKLFEKVDKHLAKDNPHRHLLLLADSGMGKSSFVLNYYARNQRLPQRKRQRLAVVPLGIPDAEEYIAKIPDPQNTVLFLDAFDEDTRAIKDHRQRLLDLMHVCRHFKRVLLTCRTQFFPSDIEIPRETGVARVGPRSAGEGATYEFWKLYLSPLNDEQVDAFLRKRYRWSREKRKQARALVKKIPLLSVRPMLLAYIPDLLETGAHIDYAFQLYEVLVEKWLERERHWVKPEALRQFSERLAVDLFINSQRRGSERIPRSELAVLAIEWSIPLDDWQLSGRSLLNRDAEGNYKFAHRSIMEYLAVKKFTEGHAGWKEAEWTDLMNAFLREMVNWCSAQGKPAPEPFKTFFWEMIRQRLAEKKPFPFDLKTADLRGFRLTLRSQPKMSLSNEEVRAMLEQQGFFDSNKHKGGKGILHLYELREREGTVIDHATGLMWQQAGSSNYMSYAEAEKYVRDLNAKRFAGYRDWRLPTLEEAMSLMEPKELGELYLDAIFDRKQMWIWTADRFSGSSCWAALFTTGYCSNPRVGYDGFVRLVR